MAVNSSGTYFFTKTGVQLAHTSKQFDTFDDFVDGLAKTGIENGGDYTYIDGSGRLMTTSYDNCNDFSNGLAMVASGSSGQHEEIYGYINNKGEQVIKAEYPVKWLYSFSDDMAAFQYYDNDKIGFINREGQVVIEPQFDGVEEGFRNGRAVVNNNDKFYFVDKTGATTGIPYDSIYTLDNGNYLVSRTRDDGDSAYGVIDGAGNEVLEVKYRYIYLTKDGKYRVDVFNSVDGNDEGLCDTDGTVLIYPQYTYIGDFSEGMAEVHQKKDGRELVGYINDHYVEAITPQYSVVDDYEGDSAFHEGYALVCWQVDYDTLYGFIDKTGQLVVDCQYYEASEFNNGRAYVWSAKAKGGDFLSKYEKGDVGYMIDTSGNRKAVITVNGYGSDATLSVQIVP